MMMVMLAAAFMHITTMNSIIACQMHASSLRRNAALARVAAALAAVDAFLEEEEEEEGEGSEEEDDEEGWKWKKNRK